MGNGNIRSFSVIPPRGLSPTDVGFRVQSVVVQNASAAWWYLPSTRTWIPPFVTNMVIPFGGSTIVEVQYTAPAAFANSNLADTPLTIDAWDVELAPNPGVSSQSALVGGTLGLRDFLTASAPSGATRFIPKAVQRVGCLFSCNSPTPLLIQTFFITPQGGSRSIWHWNTKGGNLGANPNPIQTLIEWFDVELPANSSFASAVNGVGGALIGGDFAILDWVF